MSNKILEYGGPFLGGWIFSVLAIFYPAVFLAMTVSYCFAPTYSSAMVIGIISFIIFLPILGCLIAGMKWGSPICWILVILTYGLTLPCGIELVFFDPDYVSYFEYKDILVEHGRPGWIDGWPYKDKYGGPDYDREAAEPFPAYSFGSPFEGMGEYFKDSPGLVGYFGVLAIICGIALIIGKIRNSQ